MGIGCRVEGCIAVAAGCPVSGWWRAGQCLGGINLVKVAATAWAGLGWAGLGWWWIEWIPSGGAGPACAGGGAFTWPVVGVGAMSPPHRRGYVTGMQISTHIYTLYISTVSTHIY